MRVEIETRERTLSFRRKGSDDYTRFQNKFVHKKEIFGRNFLNRKSFKHKMPTAASLNDNVKNKCIFCSETHGIELCSKTIEEKKNI